MFGVRSGIYLYALEQNPDSDIRQNPTFDAYKSTDYKYQFEIGQAKMESSHATKANYLRQLGLLIENLGAVEQSGETTNA